MRQSKRSAARHLGVALSSLQERIAVGAVTWPPESLEALRAQWLANTSAQGPAPLADRSSAPDATLASARVRKELALAGLRETELRQRCGELIEASKVTAALENTFRTCRTKLLGIPARAKQVLPHLTVGDIVELEGLVREALEELAGPVAL
jgi:phage terminase Nu1 subunit (DNA packaging protein)